jgi:hypothetical protein
MADTSNQEAAVLQLVETAIVNRLRADHPRAMVHGYNSEGTVDVEFPTGWHAVQFATAEGIQSLADFRDPRKLTDRVVLTFNLFDYAKLRWRAGKPIQGTGDYFTKLFG